MKTKFILPLVVAATLVACSDDSTTNAAVTPELSSSSDVVLPDPESSSSIDVLPTSSANGIDPIPPCVDGPYDATQKYTFYGAELTGKEKFHYGRFEARMKMAATGGTVSSMFLYYNESYLKKEEPWNEIDIEILGKDPTKWQSNIITREGDPSISKTTTSEVIHSFD